MKYFLDLPQTVHNLCGAFRFETTGLSYIKENKQLFHN